MKVVVFGLGYVGTVSAAALASKGREVVGVDTAELKVDAVNRGEPPIREPGLAELLREMVDAKRLRAVTDGATAVAQAEISMVCVGTPSRPNGALAVGALERVMSTIGEALVNGLTGHTVVVRSTTLPGTSEGLLIPLLEHGSRRVSGHRVPPTCSWRRNGEVR
jgi:GDP-mannose 6-dehydrogenase